jgi:hypothetical protein
MNNNKQETLEEASLRIGLMEIELNQKVEINKLKECIVKKIWQKHLLLVGKQMFLMELNAKYHLMNGLNNLKRKSSFAKSNNNRRTFNNKP